MSTKSTYPRGNRNGNSSSTAGGKAAVTSLRDRLRSEDPFSRQHPSTASSASHPRQDDMYLQLQKCFSDLSMSNGAQQKQAGDQVATLKDLADALADTGTNIYNAAVHQVAESHNAMALRINSFGSQSSSVLKDCKALYDNITYPLSATLCHSENYRRASIAAHLDTLQSQLAAAEGELDALNGEWVACVQEEQRIYNELGSERASRTGSPAGGSEVPGLTNQIDEIVADTKKALDQIEQEYRENMQTETMKIMQSILAD